MCPPVSPCRGASIVQIPAYNACIFCMETPLRGRSGGHTGAAPTVSFGQITHGRLLSFGWIVRKCIMVFGRGGACVPARVALQGRIHRSIPAHNACIFGMETPLRKRSGGHTGTAPTVSFGGLRMNAAACRPTRAHPSFIFPQFGELLCEKSCARMRCTAFFMGWVAPKGEPTRGL